MKHLSTLKNRFFIALGLFIISFSNFGQLGGLYTIGGAPGPLNFTTFATAVTSLNAVGVAAGGATFNVASGVVFNESPLTLSISVNQPNVTNPLVIQNAGVTPTLNFLGTATALEGAFKLVGTDYITVDGLFINDIGTSNADYMDFGFYLVRASSTNACQNVTIKNCSIDLSINNCSISPHACGIYQMAYDGNNVACQPTSVSGVFKNNSFYNNYISDVISGMSIVGSATAGFYDENMQIGTSGSNTMIVGGAATNTLIGTIFAFRVTSGKNGKVENNILSTGAGHLKSIYGLFCNGNIEGTMLINSNTVSVSGFSSTSTGILGMNIGFIGVGTETVNVINNVVENCNAGVPGYTAVTMLKAMNISSGVGVLNVTGNTVRNNICYSTTFMGPPLPCASLNNLSINSSCASIQVNGSAMATAITNISNNFVYNNSSRSWYTGILSLANNSIINSNQIYNNFLFSAPSVPFKAVTGIFLYAATASGIFNATVTSNSINDLYTDATSTAEVTGIRRYHFSPGVVTISQNTINSLTSSNSNATGVSLDYITGCLSTATDVINHFVEKNNIYNLSAGGVNATAYGIYTSWMPGGSYFVNANNNFIANLKAPISNVNPGVVGLYVGPAVLGTAYFNSISFQATSTGANFGSAGIYVNNTGTLTSLDSRNNLIVNRSTAGPTGQTVAFKLAGTNTLNFSNSSNYNSYYAGVPSAQNLIFTNGINSFQTISTYTNFIGNGRDVNAISVNPVFLSTNDLHSNDPIIAGMGIFMGGYPTDIDFQPRNTPPAVGADEPPPIILPITITSFEGNCESGKNNLKWTTASEKEAHDFIIEKSTDMVQFSAVAKVKAKNLKSDENVYTFVDEEETNKEVYYRLVQDSKILGLLNANCKTKEIVDFTIYPNPAGTSETVNVNLSAGELNQVSIQVFDCRGVKLYDKEISNEETKSKNIQLNHSFAPGMYVVSVITSTENFRKKLVIQ